MTSEQKLMATTPTTAPPRKKVYERIDRSSWAFKSLIAFAILYYARPGDVIPGLAMIPLGKITGAIALIALLLGMSGRKKGQKFPKELKLLLLLFLWWCIDVPMAWWI